MKAKEIDEQIKNIKNDILLLIEEIDKINQAIININFKFEKKINEIKL